MNENKMIVNTQDDLENLLWHFADEPVSSEKEFFGNYTFLYFKVYISHIVYKMSIETN